ncbi:hypothetical protein BD770DRAFT_387118 [Pilaira anomala]|nr:hypothetical protein BD770DRAFT_387118 [Pilaira anomala]
MVRPSSKPSLVPDQASPTSSSRTRTRPQPHVPARTSFSQVQTPQVQVSSIETPKVQTPSIEAPPIQTPKSIFETPSSENFDFSYGDKRPFSVVSPSSSGDTSSKKSSAVSIHQLRDIKDRLKRLEDAYAEIFTLRNALEHSESARRALESQVVQLKAAQQGSSTKSAPPSPPSAAKSSEAGATFASVAAKNAPKPKSKAKAKKPPAPSPRRAAATIGRLFGPKAGTPSEYHFVYYKQSIRRPLKQLRASLKNIGINVSRILDIQYPEAQIVSSKSLFCPSFCPSLCCPFFLYYNRINQTQFDVILAQERASRPSPPLPPPKLSPDEVVEKKKHLAYLGYLLHLDHEAAHSLAYAPPLVDETMMSD